MKNTEHGQITRLCAGGQFIAATGITGAINAHTQGNYTAEGLNQNGAAHKTKATPKDRQWLHTKQAQDSRNSTTTPALNVCLAGGGAYSCSLGFRRWRRLISPLIDSTTKRAVLSPSSFTFSSSSINSSGTLETICWDLLFLAPVAMFGSPCCWWHSVYAKKTFIQYLKVAFTLIYVMCMPPMKGEQKTVKPGSALTLTGLLTTNQQRLTIIVQKVAMRNNNTQRVKGLPFTVCNAYVQCTAWRTSIAVFHISAISMMRHAAYNGAVFFDGVGVASTDSVVNDAPRRPSMVLLVGERSRSLANLLAGLPIPASNATSTAVKKHLRTYNGLGYVNSAPYKTGAGRGNPKLIKATPDAASVFFCVCYMRHSMAWYAKQQGSYNRRSPAILSYHAANNGAVCASLDKVGLRSLSLLRRTPRRQRMVTLAGQPQGWPVPFIAGISTPVNVTAPIERGNSSGDSLNQIKEAA